MLASGDGKTCEGVLSTISYGSDRKSRSRRERGQISSRVSRDTSRGQRRDAWRRSWQRDGTGRESRGAAAHVTLDTLRRACNGRERALATGFAPAPGPERGGFGPEPGADATPRRLGRGSAVSSTGRIRPFHGLGAACRRASRCPAVTKGPTLFNESPAACSPVGSGALPMPGPGGPTRPSRLQPESARCLSVLTSGARLAPALRPAQDSLLVVSEYLSGRRRRLGGAMSLERRVARIPTISFPPSRPSRCAATTSPRGGDGSARSCTPRRAGRTSRRISRGLGPPTGPGASSSPAWTLMPPPAPGTGTGRLSTSPVT